MTTRRWMLVVALVAVLLAAGMCLKWRAAFLELARSHEQVVKVFDIHAQRYTSKGEPALNPDFFAADGSVKPNYAAEFKALSDHHAALGRKYRHAASRPWQAVEPDPPEP